MSAPAKLVKNVQVVRPGVALTYMRTGQYYLNRGGRYAEFFPEVLAASDGHAYSTTSSTSPP